MYEKTPKRKQTQKEIMAKRREKRKAMINLVKRYYEMKMQKV